MMIWRQNTNRIHLSRISWICSSTLSFEVPPAELRLWALLYSKLHKLQKYKDCDRKKFQKKRSCNSLFFTIFLNKITFIIKSYLICKIIKIAVLNRVWYEIMAWCGNMQSFPDAKNKSRICRNLVFYCRHQLKLILFCYSSIRHSNVLIIKEIARIVDISEPNGRY